MLSPTGGNDPSLNSADRNQITPLKTYGKHTSLVDKNESYKLLVIGDPDTGKTSIIRRYVHGQFPTDIIPSVGESAEILKIVRNNEDILALEFYDIAGEERSRCMTSVFCRGAVGAFVLMDPTKKDVFETSIKWKKDLDAKLQTQDDTPFPCVLLISKSDVTKQWAQVNATKLDHYCRQHNFIGWFHTSAKDGTNINEAVQFLVAKVFAGKAAEQTPTPKNDNKPNIVIAANYIVNGNVTNQVCSC